LLLLLEKDHTPIQSSIQLASAITWFLGARPQTPRVGFADFVDSVLQEPNKRFLLLFLGKEEHIPIQFSIQLASDNAWFLGARPQTPRVGFADFVNSVLQEPNKRFCFFFLENDEHTSIQFSIQLASDNTWFLGASPQTPRVGFADFVGCSSRTKQTLFASFSGKRRITHHSI
jgi:hypothetical protein